ncbi:MAG TPA: LysR family transcriptional regulator [Alphaproteobacteria bacterium]|nr:LysR family transcriptional regulator [Alphaproteobacteria bacterium]
MADWDDLRYVLAVARARGLTAAAAALGVNTSTVFRRLGALEAELGVRLFERLPGGYLPTAAGERLAAAAERMEEEVQAVDREITGRDHRLSGTLRVTSSETVAYRLLTDHLAAFRAAHPGIQVDLIIDNRQLSLSKREADVALRPVRPGQGDLFGRKLSDVAWTLYAARSYAEARPPLDLARPEAHDWVGWGEASTPPKVAEWLEAKVPAAAVAYRSTSLLNQMLAARAGLGVAALPCFLADPEPGLVRMAPPLPELLRELWIVTHADLRQTARIKAFFEVVGERLVRQRGLLLGEEGG